jgi:hypothetical protein
MEHLASIDPWIALGVVAATALTDAVCVLYTSSVVHRRDLSAANWASLTYMLSAFAVISFTILDLRGVRRARGVDRHLRHNEIPALEIGTRCPDG